MTDPDAGSVLVGVAASERYTRREQLDKEMYEGAVRKASRRRGVKRGK